jgi:formamidopyrimidine-DNA glycosylase
MPELPEVEVLVRHLAPLIRGRKISGVNVRRARVLRPTTIEEFTSTLTGATFVDLIRRGKYLRFTMRLPKSRETKWLIGHLGMTGRMYLLPKADPLPKHAAVVLQLGRDNFVFEDTRYFGQLTFDLVGIEKLGPEPLSNEFTVERFAADLKRSVQPIKVKLLDQRLVAGVGNIYASEALFRAGISPRKPAKRLKRPQVERLWSAIREVLVEAIEAGSTLAMTTSGRSSRKNLFYYEGSAKKPVNYEKRLRVYNRAGKPCVNCGAKIRRIVQAARSTFYCPQCQRD